MNTVILHMAARHRAMRSQDDAVHSEQDGSAVQSCAMQSLGYCWPRLATDYLLASAMTLFTALMGD